MSFPLSRCDIDTALNRKVRSVITGTEGVVTEVHYGPPFLECFTHCQRHVGTVVIEWQNGNKSTQPLCDYNQVEIIK